MHISIKRAIDNSVNRSIDQSIDSYISRFINQWSQININEITSHQLHTIQRNQSINQSIDQTSKQSINESINRSRQSNQSTNQLRNRSINQWSNQAGNQPTQRLINPSTNECEIYGNTRRHEMNATWYSETWGFGKQAQQEQGHNKQTFGTNATD